MYKNSIILCKTMMTGAGNVRAGACSIISLRAFLFATSLLGHSSSLQLQPDVLLRLLLIFSSAGSPRHQAHRPRHRIREGQSPDEGDRTAEGCLPGGLPALKSHAGLLRARPGEI